MGFFWWSDTASFVRPATRGCHETAGHRTALLTWTERDRPLHPTPSPSRLLISHRRTRLLLLATSHWTFSPARPAGRPLVARSAPAVPLQSHDLGTPPSQSPPCLDPYAPGSGNGQVPASRFLSTYLVTFDPCPGTTGYLFPPSKEPGCSPCGPGNGFLNNPQTGPGHDRASPHAAAFFFTDRLIRQAGRSAPHHRRLPRHTAGFCSRLRRRITPVSSPPDGPSSQARRSDDRRFPPTPSNNESRGNSVRDSQCPAVRGSTHCSGSLAPATNPEHACQPSPGCWRSRRSLWRPCVVTLPQPTSRSTPLLAAPGRRAPWTGPPATALLTAARHPDLGADLRKLNGLTIAPTSILGPARTSLPGKGRKGP